ncbi:VOC family protein [Magnetofaba australis]|uniref:VOC family protein n=1 Tax=Magnetofaba australis TaxID=1472297 RepID=UPI000A19DA0D|nr:VOC family protein [Magnetofaba australis]
MDAKLSLVTLGVENMARARAFYETGLGWEASGQSNENIVFFQAGACVIGLYGRRALAEDANATDPGGPIPYRSVALARNELSKEAVDRVMAQAKAAGATIVRPAQDVFWGGYSGYFADPDGHLWEVAWNPFFPVNADGSLALPD